MYKTISGIFLPVMIFCALIPCRSIAQIECTIGPVLNSNKDNTFNRMLGSDTSAFYCYRVRAKGAGTSFYIEKYSKSTLALEFSREINLGEEEHETKIEDVVFAAGNVFVFRRTYDKENDRMTLFFQMISSGGRLSTELKELAVIKTDHYEFVDFEIFPNPSKTKFLIKAAYKSTKEDSYKTDLIVIDAVNIKKLSSRRVSQNLHADRDLWLLSPLSSKESIRDMGLFLSDNDDIFYFMNEEVQDANKKTKQLKLYTLKAKAEKPEVLNLPLDSNFVTGDIEISITKDKNLVIGGFMNDASEGKKKKKWGIFSFKIDPSTNSLLTSSRYFFDEKMQAALKTDARQEKKVYYKMDYLISEGDATYYVGELYHLPNTLNHTQNYGTGSMDSQMRGAYHYHYLDVIVAKLNANGVFEWVVNSPIRNELNQEFLHLFKMYFAYHTDKNIYIFCNDHPKNMALYRKENYKPETLEYIFEPYESNFLCNTVDLKTGLIKHNVVFKNVNPSYTPVQERYWTLLPPQEAEMFIPCENREVILYSKEEDVDRFVRIKLE